jgi:hypothetical protein
MLRIETVLERNELIVGESLDEWFEVDGLPAELVRECELHFANHVSHGYVLRVSQTVGLRRVGCSECESLMDMVCLYLVSRSDGFRT